MTRIRIAGVTAISFLILFAALAATSRPAAKPVRAPGVPRTVVLELFTSQGCSSCPPADGILSKLGKETYPGASIIPLAWHVDYWNYLGWSDPFSSAAASERQGAYARALGSGRIYTPQIVLNGTSQMVGSAESAIRDEIARQLAQPERGSVMIDPIQRTGGTLKIGVHARLAGTAEGSDARVIAALFENGASTMVVRGENSGHRLPNDYIVRWSAPLGAVSRARPALDTSVDIPIRPEWNLSNLGVVVLIQDGRSMAIYHGASRPVMVPAMDSKRSS
jgi:hypothetical protein